MFTKYIPFYNLLLCLKRCKIIVPKVMKIEIAKYSIYEDHFQSVFNLNHLYDEDFDIFKISIKYSDQQTLELYHTVYEEALCASTNRLSLQSRMNPKRKSGLPKYIQDHILNMYDKVKREEITAKLETNLRSYGKNKSLQNKEKAIYYASLLDKDITNELKELETKPKTEYFEAETDFEMLLDKFMKIIFRKKGQDIVMDLVYFDYYCEKLNLNRINVFDFIKERLPKRSNK